MEGATIDLDSDLEWHMREIKPCEGALPGLARHWYIPNETHDGLPLKQRAQDSFGLGSGSTACILQGQAQSRDRVRPNRAPAKRSVRSPAAHAFEASDRGGDV